jgi:hypothetical protein
MEALHHFKYMKTEVADVDSYFGSFKLSELLSFMEQLRISGG